MSRPAQVVEQIARAKEIQEEMQKGENQDGAPADDTPPPPPQEPVVQPPVDNSPVTVSKEDYDKLDQRYRTLQGMYTADTNRLRTELGYANDAIQDLEDRLAAVESRSQEPPQTQNKYVTDADREEFGDTIEMVRRAAREEAEAVALKQEQAYQQRIAQLESELGSFRNKVIPKVEDLSKSQAEKVQSEYWNTLTAQVPDWRKINDSKEFKNWLLEQDPVTGSNRQQFLAAAHNNMDAARVIRFFQEWKRIAAGGQTPAPHNPQTDLERLVAPGTSKSGVAPGEPEKRKWTGADIEKFYADVTKGVYAKRLEERNRIEADIFAAKREGRIVY